MNNETNPLSALGELAQRVQVLLSSPGPRTPQEFRRLEQEAAQLGRELSAQVVEHHIAKAHEDAVFVRRVVDAKLHKSLVKLRKMGSKVVEILLASGERVKVQTPYLMRDLRGRPGRRRAPGKRGEAGTGSYPILEQLGIAERCTPEVRYLTALNLATQDSYQVALDSLALQGLDLDQRAFVRYALHTAQGLVDQRDARLDALVRSGQAPLAGQRVQVSIDGGRAQIRTNTTRGRPKKNGRRGFVTEWKEPKGFIIQALDEKGRCHKKFLPFIDFTMGDCNALFGLLTQALKGLGAGQAELIEFVSDGSDWLWNRVDALRDVLEIPEAKILKVLDFYHACEYLSNAANAMTDWTPVERAQLYEGLKGYLRHGDTLHLFARLTELHDQTAAAPLLEAHTYLSNRKNLLNYSVARHLGLPIGSGAIESTVKRVVNQRFKGASVKWLPERLEPFLHLRALIKCGRFDQAFDQLLASADLLAMDEAADSYAKATQVPMVAEKKAA